MNRRVSTREFGDEARCVFGRESDRSRAPSGFTLIELLVVVAIVGILASLVLTAVSAAEGRAHRIACVSNLKQFGVALYLYADHNDDLLPPNLDGEDIPLGRTWVQGWLGLPGPDCTNTTHLRRSLLGRYLGDAKVWQCPSAELVTVAGITQPRVRTVSLNCFMGSPVKSPAARTYRRLGDIVDLSPTEAISFLGEKEETINDGSFAMQWSFEAKNPAGWILRDKPEVSHDGGGNLAFADGHVETRRWEDERTLSASRDDSRMPGNADILWIQQRATWRP